MSSTSTSTAMTTAGPRADVEEHEKFAPIPFSRVVSVELRKMFDTRSGLWLMIGIAAAAVLATVSVVAFAPDSQLTYGTFASAIGVPMSILLPVMAILSVTSEWSQRTGLTTFTYVPHRGRVIGAKAVCAVGVGVVSVAVAAAAGALGNVVGSAIAGVPTVWDTPPHQWLEIALANVLGLLLGFMLGLLFRNSPAAIVGAFVYNFVVPSISGILAHTTSWWAPIRHWVDFSQNQNALFDGVHSARLWEQLAVSGLIWLVVPLVVGVVLVLRSEVK